jgi:hypothetical protein
VTFTIDGEDKALWASLTFKLVVPSGTGASASGVGLYDAQGGLIAPENTVSPAVSEAQFTYNHLVFGSYKIGGVIQGYGYYESYVYIDHQETDLGTIKLEEPFELKASIVGPDGRQRPQTELGDSTWVLVWRFDDSGRSHVSRSSRFEPESDGTFLLELSPGEYCIQAVGAWTSDIRRIIGGPEESQVVTLPTVRPATLVIQPGEYWNHIAVRVLNSVGEEEQRRSFAGPEPVRIATSSHSGTVSVVDWGGAVLGSVPYSMQEGTAIVRLEDIRSR